MSSLTPKHLQAVSWLAQGKTHAEVASELGIATKTVQRWSKQPEFTQAVSDVQSRAVEVAVEETAQDIAGKIERLVPKAIAVLDQYLSDMTARGSDRLRAVHIIGTWAGLSQAQAKPEDTVAETQFKDYLTYLSIKNGQTNGNGTSQHQPVQ